MENVVASTLLHHLERNGGEAARISHALLEPRTQRDRVGELDDFDAANPEVVDQPTISGLIAAACRSAALRNGAAIGDAQGTLTLAPHSPTYSTSDAQASWCKLCAN